MEGVSSSWRKPEVSHSQKSSLIELRSVCVRVCVRACTRVRAHTHTHTHTQTVTHVCFQLLQRRELVGKTQEFSVPGGAIPLMYANENRLGC